MKLRITRLKSNLNFFDDLVDMLYLEWKPLYFQYGYTTKDSVRKLYESMIDNIYIALTVSPKEKLVGSYSIKKNTISDVYVKEKYRKLGLGYVLVNNAVSRLWYYYVVRLYSEKSTLKFYKKCGFEATDVRLSNMTLMIRKNHILVFSVAFIIIAVAIGLMSI